jgi:hypothetical protein
MRTRSDQEARFPGKAGLLASRALVLVSALLLLVAALTYAGAESTPDEVFTLARAVVGAGGSPATGAGFELDATAGQPAAGPALGADAGLMAGFWGAPPNPAGHVYLPVVLR